MTWVGGFSSPDVKEAADGQAAADILGEYVTRTAADPVRYSRAVACVFEGSMCETSTNPPKLKTSVGEFLIPITTNRPTITSLTVT